MKKTAVILLAVLLVSMLGGCYKSELVMDVGYDGEVELSTTLVTETSTFEALGMSNLDEYYKNIESLKDGNESIKDEKYHIRTERVDETGAVLPEGTQWPEEGKMVGTRATAKFKNLAEAKSSLIMENNFFFTPLAKDDKGYGIDIEEKRTLFGTKYTASGKISIKGSEDMQQYLMMGESDENAFEKASNSVTFNFPFAFSKSNADEKNVFGNKLTWTATSEAPEKEISFEVFVINPVILAAGFIILILLVVILILALRKKKKPDAFFVDAEGNEIPVFDVAETEGDFEVEAEVLEEVQETSEEAEEIPSFEEVVVENEDTEEVMAENEETDENKFQ